MSFGFRSGLESELEQAHEDPDKDLGSETRGFGQCGCLMAA